MLAAHLDFRVYVVVPHGPPMASANAQIFFTTVSGEPMNQ
jgi:hypothetical protein